MNSPIASTQSASNKDSRLPTGQCSLKQSRLQLVPVRYALSEHKPIHNAINSQYSDLVEYRPIGIRPILEDGYIYIIHSLRPDIIYAYKVSEFGKIQKIEQTGTLVSKDEDKQEFVYINSETKISIKREGFIYVLYTKYPVTPKLQSHLLLSTMFREQVMQKCDIGGYDCEHGARHLLPPHHLEVNLSDCHTEKYVDEHAWCWFQKGSKPVKQDASSVLSYIDDKKESAILILDDPIILMSDLSSAKLYYQNIEIEWFLDEDNKRKYYAATQLNLLIEIGAMQFRQSTTDQKIINHVSENLDDVKSEYYRYIEIYKAYGNLDALQTKDEWDKFKDTYKDTPYVYEGYEKINIDLDLRAGKIGIKKDALKKYYNKVKENHDNLLYGEYFWEDGIKDSIRKDEMDSWLSDKQKIMRVWDEENEVLISDLNNLRPRVYEKVPIFDKDDEDQFVFRLVHENRWLEASLDIEKNHEKLRDFYFSNLGEQNLQWYKYKDEDKFDEYRINNKLKTTLDYDGWSSDITNGEGVYSAYREVNSGMDAFHEFNTLLLGNNIIEIDNMPLTVRAELNKFGSQFASLSAIELDVKLKNLKATQGAVDTLLHNTGPGMKAIFLGSVASSEIKLDIGTGSGVDYNGKINVLSDLNSKINAIEYELKNITSQGYSDKYKKNRKKRLRKKRIKLEAKSRTLVLELGLLSTSLSNVDALPASHITVKSNGMSALELDEALKFRRDLLTQQLLFGDVDGGIINRGVNTAISGGFGLVAVVLNYWNWSNTVEDLNKRTRLNSYQISEYIGDTFALIAASLAMISEITRVISLYKYINTANSSWAKLAGKSIVIGNIAISVTATLAAMFDAYKQIGNFRQSLRQGNDIAAVGCLLAFSGDIIQLALTKRIAVESILQIRTAMSVSTSASTSGWLTAGNQLLKFGVRLNVAMLVGSALVFLGEVIYNLSQSKGVIDWAKQCIWAHNEKNIFKNKTNQNWDYNTHLRKWQEVMQTPVVQVQSMQYEYESLVRKGTGYELTSTIVTRETAKQFIIVIPLTRPEKIDIGFVFSSGNGTDVLIKTGIMKEISHVVYDGLNTVVIVEYELLDMSHHNLRYMDVYIRVKNKNDEILFNEQGAARFGIDLMTISLNDKVDGYTNLYNIEMLEEEDVSLFDFDDIASSLISLRDVEVQKDIVFEGELV